MCASPLFLPLHYIVDVLTLACTWGQATQRRVGTVHLRDPQLRREGPCCRRDLAPGAVRGS